MRSSKFRAFQVYTFPGRIGGERTSGHKEKYYQQSLSLELFSYLNSLGAAGLPPSSGRTKKLESREGEEESHAGRERERERERGVERRKKKE